MAGDAERELGQFEELLRRAIGASGGQRRGLTFIPVVFGVARDDSDSETELERVVMINQLTRGMVVFEGDARLLSDLLATGLAEASSAGPPPASKASIEALRAVDLGEECEDDEEECPVCLDGLRSDTLETAPEEEADLAVVKEMPCRHRFHGGCIEKWLGMHGSCPVCRFQMPAEEDETKKVPVTSGAGETDRPRELVITISFGGRGGRVSEQQRQQ